MKQFKNTIGIIALICGVIGLAIAVSSSNGGFIYDSTLPEQKQESLKEKGVGLLKEKFLGKEKEPVIPQKPPGFVVSNVYVLITGLIAVILGICSKFIRQQKSTKKQRTFSFDLHFDTAGAGLTLGLIALLWSYMVIAVIIGVIIFVLFTMLNSGIDIGV